MEDEFKKEDHVFGVVSTEFAPVARESSKGRASTCQEETERLSRLKRPGLYLPSRDRKVSQTLKAGPLPVKHREKG
jgi:hypothetical protein